MTTDFAKRLLDWFDVHGRKDLPWQQDISPYRVWVSEIMLQQTQVATVIPYYERFMQRFPSVDLLAAAKSDEVLHLWTGLGYYARARNLHACAQRIMQAHNGEFPMDVEQLEMLPGIGRSTAGAIKAICSNQRAAILDGNVKRVLARCFAVAGWPGTSATQKALWVIAEELTPTDRVADYTQAIMDLGAMVCTRSSPDCNACPFSDDCRARISDTISEYPGKKPKKTLPVRRTTMLIVRQKNAEVLLQKRPDSGLWGGLWSFPETEDLDHFLDMQQLTAIQIESLTPFRHTFTHFHLQISPMLITIEDPPAAIAEDKGVCWYNPDAPIAIGLTKPVTKLLGVLHRSTLFQ